jgi:hypothetical protein
MKRIIKEMEKCFFIKTLLFFPKKLNRYFKHRILSDKAYVKSQYKSVFGKRLNLNSPKYFTEKIQWLKLYDRNPLYTICADKFKVREYVSKKIGEEYLIPLIFYTENPETIPFNMLPSEYIIKTNHTSGYNMIYRNKKIYFFDHVHNFSKKKVVKILKNWLKKNVFYQNREWEYKKISPKIIIEELLTDGENNGVLNDYKIHCFNGEPKYIQTIFDRNEGVKENWYDTSWNSIDLYYYSKNKKQIKKPKNLQELLKVSRALSAEFNYVRVDLYIIRGKVLFGELTFHPYGGLMKFKPSEWDLKLGDLLKLNY